MSLNPLIKGQTIRIDAHQRGTTSIDEWDNRTTDIHMDKRTNTKLDGKPVEAILRIPLNSEREVSCVVKKVQNSATAKRISKEVHRAFSDTKVRRDFIYDLLDCLDNYPSKFTSTQKAERALQKLADHFGLTEKLLKQVIIDCAEKIEGIKLRYIGEDGKTYFITGNKDEIIVGQETIAERNRATSTKSK